jgi:GMP synthase-like glutamine amidotransferase
MKILVLQHVVSEHPGVLRDFLREDGLSWDTIELDEGREIPDLEPYDLMIVMGGPQDVWEEDQYPWMRTEKAAIRTFVMDMRRPYLGVPWTPAPRGRHRRKGGARQNARDRRADHLQDRAR